MFNWLFTLYRGRIRFELPMMWTLAFMLTFVIGGMTGVLLAVPPADFVLHNSLFLVAHFHNVIIGGVVFGVFAGISYWFPKAFGFRLDPFWGKMSFWFWVTGFYLAFMPLYVRPDSSGHRVFSDPDLRQHSQARSAARPHRRPMGWPDAGMVHGFAAARV
jgi:cytochrome o ubiquinol oxidase subunit 1